MKHNGKDCCCFHMDATEKRIAERKHHRSNLATGGLTGGCEIRLEYQPRAVVCLVSGLHVSSDPRISGDHELRTSLQFHNGMLLVDIKDECGNVLARIMLDRNGAERMSSALEFAASQMDGKVRCYEAEMDAAHYGIPLTDTEWEYDDLAGAQDG